MLNIAATLTIKAATSKLIDTVYATLYIMLVGESYVLRLSVGKRVSVFTKLGVGKRVLVFTKLDILDSLATNCMHVPYCCLLKHVLFICPQFMSDEHMLPEIHDMKVLNSLTRTSESK